MHINSIKRSKYEAQILASEQSSFNGGEASFTSFLKEISTHLEDIGMLKQALVLEKCSQDKLFFNCGCRFHEFTKRCNYYKVCPVCSELRRTKVRNQFIKKLDKARPYLPRYYTQRGLRLLTLTYANFSTLDELFSVGLPEFKHSIKNFLRRDYIKSRIYAGIGVFEIERNKNGFFLHSHLLVDSRYLDNRTHKSLIKKGVKNPRSRLSEEWFQATDKKAYVVDVKAVYSTRGGLNYVLKYITKPHNFTPYESALYFKLSYKKRSFFTFGNFYNQFNSLPERFICEECGCPLQYVSSVFNYLGEEAQRSAVNYKPPPSHTLLKYQGFDDYDYY